MRSGLLYDEARSLLGSAGNCLRRHGEMECPTRTTRTTGRVRYVPGAIGFRCYVDFDGPVSLDTEPKGSTLYCVSLGTAERSLKPLRRWEKILRSAGFDVVLDTVRFKKYKVLFVLADMPQKP